MFECITMEEFIHQAQEPSGTTPTPGILLEAEKTTSAEDLAFQLFSPLSRQNSCQSPLWITASCVSWDEAAALPQKLVRRAVLEGGLRSRFHGGAVIDLRWCSNSPPDGQLSRLERFLLELRCDLQPLILTSPGTSHAVRAQLSALQLQSVTIGQEAQKPKTRAIGFEREY